MSSAHPLAPGRPAWLGAAAGMFAVAWGANQFVSMLVAYREHRGVSTAVNDGLFGIYALTLIVALLLCGPATDLWGRARVVRPAVLLSLLATVLLLAGSNSLLLLFAGRFVAGIASGAIFAAGSAWVKELSGIGDEKAGARRATIALSLGFGLGPLITGIVAQWAPAPLVSAYLPHLLITAMAAPAVWSAPETVTRTPSGPSFLTRLKVPSASNRRFLGVVVPAAPWVFGGPAVSFAVLPSLVSGRTHGHGIVFAGAVAGITLGVGVAVQPVARRLDQPGRVTVTMLALASTILGLVVAAIAASTRDPLVVLFAAIPLGAGYGLGMVAGLLHTQRMAGPSDLAGLIAVFYSLTYIGFALPIVLAAVHSAASYPVMLSAVAGLAALTLLTVWMNGVRRAGLATRLDC